MNELRDEFLTEAMGKCWHNEYKHLDPTFEDRYDIYVCTNCNKASAYSPSLPRYNFSTWNYFGILYEWARNQKWWNQFAGNNLGKWSFNGKKVFIYEDNINPDIFSNILYEWGLVWFESFGIINHQKGTYDI